MTQDKSTPSAADDELEGLDPETARKVRSVADYCARMDANGPLEGLPEMVQADYLHDVRNAVEGLAQYDKRGVETGSAIEAPRKDCVEALKERIRAAEQSERDHKGDSPLYRRELAGYTRGLKDALFALAKLEKADG